MFVTNIKMDFKLVVFFAFIVTVHCENLKDEIARILKESSCNTHAAALNYLKIDKVCDIPANGQATWGIISCNATRDAITSICHEFSNFLDQLLKPDVKFANGSDFCGKQVDPIKETLNVSRYVSEFVKRFNKKQCPSLCSSPDDELYFLCPFMINYLRFLEKVEVAPAKVKKPFTPEKPPAETVVAESVHIDTQSIGKQELQSRTELTAKQDTKTDSENQSPIINNLPINQTSGTNNAEKSGGNLPTQQQSNPQNNKKEVKPPSDGESSPSEVVNEDRNPPNVPIKDGSPPEEGNKEVIPPLNDDGNNDPEVPMDEFKDDKPLPAIPNESEDVEEGEKKTPPEIVVPAEKSENSPSELAKPERKNIVLDPYVDSPNPHFFAYFVFISALCIFFYVAMYNKKKILALMIEGRRSNVKRRPNSAAYSKLDCNLEEAMTSGPSTSSSNTLLY